jgi:MinD superfamily P-loop ATPase
MKFSTTFIWTPRSDSVVKLMKNKAQQKLFQILDSAETLTCDSYISQIRSDKKVILVAFERCLSLVSLIKIS